MKTYFLSLALLSISLLSCKKETHLHTPGLDVGTKIPMTSINAMKDGVPFINYLGIKLPGC